MLSSFFGSSLFLRLSSFQSYFIFEAVLIFSVTYSFQATFHLLTLSRSFLIWVLKNRNARTDKLTKCDLATSDSQNRMLCCSAPKNQHSKTKNREWWPKRFHNPSCNWLSRARKNMLSSIIPNKDPFRDPIVSHELK